METIVEEGGGKQAEVDGEAGSELLDDLPWGETSLVRIGASQVEVELVEGSLSQELGAAGKGFQVVELVLDQAVDGFDVTLVGVSGGRDANVLGAEEGDGAGKAGTRAVFLQLADELPAVVGLPSDVREVDAAALQVGLNTLREQGAGLGGAVGGIGEKLQAAADLARRVLDDGQAAPLHWRPVVRDVVEILGVGGDLLEQGPGFFHGGEILLLFFGTCDGGDGAGRAGAGCARWPCGPAAAPIRVASAGRRRWAAADAVRPPAGPTPRRSCAARSAGGAGEFL